MAKSCRTTSSDIAINPRRARQVDGPDRGLLRLDVRRLRDRHVSAGGPERARRACSASKSPPNPALKDQWFGVIMSVFLVGAATGGVVFGWLGDRIGRVRAMSLSIFTYAIFTGLCGFATEAWHIAVLRFIASLGMGGEWALGVALVTELWPDKSRACRRRPDRRRFQRGHAARRPAQPGAGQLHRRRGQMVAEPGRIARHRRHAAQPRRLATGDDRRRPAGAAHFFHSAVCARVAQMGGRTSQRRNVALGHSRPPGRR